MSKDCHHIATLLSLGFQTMTKTLLWLVYLHEQNVEEGSWQESQEFVGKLLLLLEEEEEEVQEMICCGGAGPGGCFLFFFFFFFVVAS